MGEWTVSGRQPWRVKERCCRKRWEEGGDREMKENRGKRKSRRLQERR